MQSARLTVVNEVGLHARPAALFVQACQRHQAEIRLRNLANGSGWVDAKSILSVLTLGVEKNHEIEIEAEGPQETETIAALTALINSDFDDRA
ncbi:MAG: HPr family phosphocarrier protein [Chloroflexota bacterium]